MAVRQKAVATLMRALRKETSKPHNQQLLPSLRRAFSLYDQVNLIDNVPEDQLRFQGYTDEGFTVNGVSYEGGVLCVGNLITSWSPKKFSDITVDRFWFVASVVVICCQLIYVPNCAAHTRNFYPWMWEKYSASKSELRRFIRSTGMKLEALDSRNASSTYNILNEEGRIVAAALLPYGVTS